MKQIQNEDTTPTVNNEKKNTTRKEQHATFSVQIAVFDPKRETLQPSSPPLRCCCTSELAEGAVRRRSRQICQNRSSTQIGSGKRHGHRRATTAVTQTVLCELA